MERSERILSYETQGFVHLPGVLEPAILARLKAAFDRAVGKHATSGSRPERLQRLGLIFPRS
jgi:hypothetical protein